MANATTLDDVVCLGCGCLCDDLRVTLQSGRPTATQPDCPLAAAWLTRIAAWRLDACRIDGRESTAADALTRAAGLLSAARAPLVCGLAGADLDAQRVAVEIADRLGGFVDWTTTAAEAAAVEARQTVGAVGASLGEVAQRADLVIFWRCDPPATHPRHFERYSLDPKSTWLPRGRADRRVVVVGDPLSASAAHADDVVTLASGGSLGALARLRGVLAGVGLAPAGEEADGLVDELTNLAARIRASRYAVVFYGGELEAEGRATLIELTLLAQAAQETTRLVTAPLGGAGNAAGARAVLTWQTGYPMAVGFARGFPEYGPPEWTTGGLLESGEADALLVVAEEGLAGLSDAALGRAQKLPSVVLGSQASDTLAATVRFSVPPLGSFAGGDVFRSDGAVLPLRHTLAETADGHAGVLRGIAARLAPAVSGSALGP